MLQTLGKKNQGMWRSTGWAAGRRHLKETGGQVELADTGTYPAESAEG